MPAEIAELADGMWQRALKLAGEAAAHDDNAARERLRQLELELDIRRRSYELREQEIDAQARARERALSDARDHLLSLSKALSREQATNEAHARRSVDLETMVAQYRQQMAELIAGAITQNRSRPRRNTASSTASLSGSRKPPAAARRAKQVRAKRKAAKKSASRHRSPAKTPRRKR
jgi:hypothetical protein